FRGIRRSLRRTAHLLRFLWCGVVWWANIRQSEHFCKQVGGEYASPGLWTAHSLFPAAPFLPFVRRVSRQVLPSATVNSGATRVAARKQQPVRHRFRPQSSLSAVPCAAVLPSASINTLDSSWAKTVLPGPPPMGDTGLASAQIAAPRPPARRL